MPFNYYAQGVACTEVELDALTGDHCVLRTDILMDVGALFVCSFGLVWFVHCLRAQAAPSAPPSMWARSRARSCKARAGARWRSWCGPRPVTVSSPTTILLCAGIVHCGIRRHVHARARRIQAAVCVRRAAAVQRFPAGQPPQPARGALQQGRRRGAGLPPPLSFTYSLPSLFAASLVLGRIRVAGAEASRLRCATQSPRVLHAALPRHCGKIFL